MSQLRSFGFWYGSESFCLKPIAENKKAHAETIARTFCSRKIVADNEKFYLKRFIRGSDNSPLRRRSR